MPIRLIIVMGMWIFVPTVISIMYPKDAKECITVYMPEITKDILNGEA